MDGWTKSDPGKTADEKKIKKFSKICHLLTFSNVFIVKRSFANAFMITKGVHK